MDGIINIYKEKGYTSHDVVARMRGITGIRHIGHTGTLDPDAEGVLPICIGTATKICDFLTDTSKVYEAVLMLGIETDTQDASGAVVSVSDADAIEKLTEEKINEALAHFCGEYDQLPPMYSAVQVNGQRLYSAARAGHEVERETRRVNILKLERTSDTVKGTFGVSPQFKLSDNAFIGLFGTTLEKGHWQRVERGRENRNDEELNNVPVIRLCISVECSKGTYIRTLCHDIGEYLGVHGCVEKLLRVRVGEFVITDSVRLCELEKIKGDGSLEEYIKPADTCFPDYPSFNTKEKYDATLINGNVLYFRHFSQYITKAPSPVKVYTSTGKFAGVYEFIESKNRYQPLKMFVSEEEIKEWNSK